ncbi:unnamed protein product [Moneuplotes crassus]|uniref:Uncharacterized protein n=1 Tax=Euplotes crassus TaxID=5936 RepID=A0AAD2D2Y3_EUPCR|nr:unnamed protein product [Moneuplotes crassus]
MLFTRRKSANPMIKIFHNEISSSYSVTPKINYCSCSIFCEAFQESGGKLQDEVVNFFKTIGHVKYELAKSKFPKSEILKSNNYSIQKSLKDSYIKDYKKMMSRSFYTELAKSNPAYTQNSYEDYRYICNKLYPLLFISSNIETSHKVVSPCFKPRKTTFGRLTFANMTNKSRALSFPRQSVDHLVESPKYTPKVQSGRDKIIKCCYTCFVALKMLYMNRNKVLSFQTPQTKAFIYSLSQKQAKKWTIDDFKKLVNFYLLRIQTINSYESWAPQKARARTPRSRKISGLSFMIKRDKLQKRTARTRNVSNNTTRRNTPTRSLDLQQGRNFPPMQGIRRTVHTKIADTASKNTVMDDSVSKISFPVESNSRMETSHNEKDFYLQNENLDNFVTSLAKEKEDSVPSPKFGCSMIRKEDQSKLDKGRHKVRKSRSKKNSKKHKKSLIINSPSFENLYDPNMEWHKPNHFWDKIIQMNQRALRIARRREGKSKKSSKSRSKSKSKSRSKSRSKSANKRSKSNKYNKDISDSCSNLRRTKMDPLKGQKKSQILERIKGFNKGKLKQMDNFFAS